MVDNRAVTVALDFALKNQLRAVIADHTVTEATLRKLTEQGRACALILDARLERRVHSRNADVIDDPGTNCKAQFALLLETALAFGEFLAVEIRQRVEHRLALGSRIGQEACGTVP